jgi:hypothetical protein
MARHEALLGAETMKSNRRSGGIFGRTYLFVVLITLPSVAFAYIDPGSGMLLIQGLVAAIGAIIVFIKSPISTIKRMIARWRRRDE